MEAAFSLTAAQAYRVFRNRKLDGEESVDGYTVDRKRLLKMSGQDVAADGRNRVVIEQFLSGLPTEYARQSRTNADTDTIQKYVTYVRKLRSAERPSGTANGMAAASMGPGSQAKFLCYECNEPGHRAKEFPKKRAYQRKRGWSQPSKQKAPVARHVGDEEGHFKCDCPARQKCLAERKKSAAAVPAEAGDGSCLLTPIVIRPTNHKPRIFVDIWTDAGSERQKDMSCYGHLVVTITRELRASLINVLCFVTNFNLYHRYSQQSTQCSRRCAPACIQNG